MYGHVYYQELFVRLVVLLHDPLAREHRATHILSVRALNSRPRLSIVTLSWKSGFDLEITIEVLDFNFIFWMLFWGFNFAISPNSHEVLILLESGFLDRWQFFYDADQIRKGKMDTFRKIKHVKREILWCWGKIWLRLLVLYAQLDGSYAKSKIGSFIISLNVECTVSLSLVCCCL